MTDNKYPEPFLWVSPEQANALVNAEGEHGAYLPTRKTSAGKFTMPLYAAQPAVAQAAPAAVAGPSVRKVFLVATGETCSGEETYTRHDDAPPPLCDAECLYTAAPTTQPASQPERDIEAEALEYIFGANLDWLRMVDEKLTPPWPRECHVIAMGMRHVSQAAPSQDAGALAQLRHLYANMVGGAVRDADGAKRIANGILGPAIERLERAARAQQEDKP